MTSMVQTLIYPSYKIVQWYILASVVFQFLLNSSAFMGVTNSLLHEVAFYVLGRTQLTRCLESHTHGVH